MGTKDSVILHSHISGAPFQGEHQFSYGLNVDVYQQPGCVVDQLRLDFDVWATLAKITLRLRIATIVWAIGWSAAVLYRQLTAFRASGERDAQVRAHPSQMSCRACQAFSHLIYRGAYR